MENNFFEATSFLSDFFKNKMSLLPTDVKNRTVEIRLRREMPLALTLENGTTYFLERNGQISEDPCGDVLICSGGEIEQSFLSLCRYSVHTHQTEISQGYIMLRGGHRAGIAGRGVTEKGEIINITDISSVNLRIAHEIRGCAAPISDLLLTEQRGILIAGPPLCGKTTVLRDAVRMLSSGEIGSPKSVLLADERGEISAFYKGKAYNDVGMCTDVYCGIKKSDAINMGIRVMSPRYAACDEITEQEAPSLCAALNSGVRAICTVHADCPDSLKEKKAVYSLVESGVFGSVVFLERGGKIKTKLRRENF